MVEETTKRTEDHHIQQTYSQRIHSEFSTRILQVTAVEVSVRPPNRTLFDGPNSRIPNATVTVVFKRAGL